MVTETSERKTPDMRKATPIFLRALVAVTMVTGALTLGSCSTMNSYSDNSNTPDFSELSTAVETIPGVVGTNIKSGMDGLSVTGTITLDFADESYINEGTMKELAADILAYTPPTIKSVRFIPSVNGKTPPLDILQAAFAFAPNINVGSTGSIAIRLADLSG